MEQIYFVLEALIEAVQTCNLHITYLQFIEELPNEDEFARIFKKKLKSDKSIFGVNASGCNSCNALA